jgi:alpha/beta superfamily hydrolase
MTTPPSSHHRHLRIAQLTFAGAAAVALLALSHTAQADTPSVHASDSVRLADWSAPGGFATDDSDDQAQLQQQLAMQEMLQAEQQAEQQNEAAQQQAQLAEQQAQIDQQQANNP